MLGMKSYSKEYVAAMPRESRLRPRGIPKAYR
jgi:hypothetical protein